MLQSVELVEARSPERSRRIKIMKRLIAITIAIILMMPPNHSLCSGSGHAQQGYLSSAALAKEDALRPMAKRNTNENWEAVMQGVFKKRRISKWRARRLADLFDRTLNKHKQSIIDIRDRDRWGILIRYSSSLTDVDIYTNKKNRIVCFPDQSCNSMMYFLIKSRFRNKPIGYGGANLVPGREGGYKVLFRFQLFPEYRRKGKGAAVLDLILAILLDKCKQLFGTTPYEFEFYGIDMNVQVSMEGDYIKDYDIYIWPLHSPLGKILARRGFVTMPDPDTPEPDDDPYKLFSSILRVERQPILAAILSAA